MPAGVIDRPRTADVPGMQHDARHSAGDRLAVQQRLDRRLADAVLAVGGTRLVLGDRHPCGRAVDPDGAAVHQQRPGRPQGVDELPRGLGREAEHVDDGVGSQRGDPLAEHPGRVLGLAIDDDPLDRRHSGADTYGLAFAPAERHDLVTGPYQARDQVAPDVPGGADHDDAADRPSVTFGQRRTG